MTAEQFALWLQGFAELTPEPPSAQQWASIRDHLALVFDKVTPDRVDPPARPLVTEEGVLRRREYPLDAIRRRLRPQVEDGEVRLRPIYGRDRIIC